MGCAQSKVDNEEAVARCKERRNVIKEAVTASKAFAAGHFAYAIALKNTGAALSDYGHGESDQTLDLLEQSRLEKQSERAAVVDPAPPPPPPIESLPPPPPPLPKFSPSPIKRAVSLPAGMAGRGRKVKGGVDDMAIEEEDEEEEDEEEEEEGVGKVEGEEESSPRTPENVGKGRKRQETPEIVSASPASSLAWDYFFMEENVPGPDLEDREVVGNGFESQKNHNFRFNEEIEEEEEEEEKAGMFRKNSGHIGVEEMEPKTPEKVEEEEEEEKGRGKNKIEHANTAPPEFRRATTASNVNLMKILDEIDDRFLKASECAQEVSKMLEATRLHYHSNFADNRGCNSTPLLSLSYPFFFFYQIILFIIFFS